MNGSRTETGETRPSAPGKPAAPAECGPKSCGTLPEPAEGQLHSTGSMGDNHENAKMSLKKPSAGLKEFSVTLGGYFLWLKLTTLHVELTFLWLTGYYAGLKFYCAWLKGAFL